jgi:60 kDa SS-A/Ro ribonucleoprotein
MFFVLHIQEHAVQHAEIYNAICRPNGGEDAVQRGKGAPRVVRGKTRGWAELAEKYPLVQGYTLAKSASTPEEIGDLVQRFRLERELLPTEHMKHPAVWEALIPNLGYTALLRNLGNMARSGLLAPHAEAVKTVRERLENTEALMRARVHPWQVLLAARIYSAGHGFRSHGEGWTPVPQLVDALDGVFEASFGNVTPTGKRFFMGIDVSSSMSWTSGSPISAAEAAAAFAMVTVRTEPEYYAFGFATAFRDLGITARDSLVTVLAKTSKMTFGGTDCAVPMKYALANKIPVDVFAVYSDGESWAGNVHATEALKQYRRTMSLPAKLACVNFTATDTALADPKDAGQMNFCGFGADLPSAIATFISE